MGDSWVAVGELKKRLQVFFGQQKKELNRFGSAVNQTFEAFVFAQVVGWYKTKPGWTVKMVNPKDEKTKKEIFRLKFSTRGRSGRYSYVLCTPGDGGQDIQVRHQLRVATHHYKTGTHPKANVCLDVAVVRNVDLQWYSTNDYVSNEDLISFGEAKHMSAFAELLAGFIGMVHELQPQRLKRIRTKTAKLSLHPAPFLFVSGKLWHTAEGILETVRRRKYDIDVFSKTKALCEAIVLPTEPAKPSNEALKLTGAIAPAA